jgi:hypothetical protein
MFQHREAVEILKKMALYSDLSDYKSTHDVLESIFSFLKDFNKVYKYTV